MGELPAVIRPQKSLEHVEEVPKQSTNADVQETAQKTLVQDREGTDKSAEIIIEVRSENEERKEECDHGHADEEIIHKQDSPEANRDADSNIRQPDKEGSISLERKIGPSKEGSKENPEMDTPVTDSPPKEIGQIGSKTSEEARTDENQGTSLHLETKVADTKSQDGNNEEGS